MNVLVINSGSSSLKYQLLETKENKVLAKGLCERIGIDGRLKHNKPGMDQLVRDIEMKDHKQAIKYVIDILVDPTYGVISDMSEIEACGHRIVHGGSYFSESVLVTDEVIKTLEEDCTAIAPLHTPGHVAGIKGCIEAMPNTPQVVVFDTAFHQTMPKKAYTYALPQMYYDKYKIRKYGFHGTSHKYVSGRAIDMLGGKAEGTKIVTCHLGNGSSSRRSKMESAWIPLWALPRLRALSWAREPVPWNRW